MVLVTTTAEGTNHFTMRAPNGRTALPMKRWKIFTPMAYLGFEFLRCEEDCATNHDIGCLS